ncbi:hypothetical protein [Nocardia implantans]|uniref:Uncharacterized protein n=2 Tax=Nocardia TaxID=1817 RepID=A0ABU6AWX3_9NOCA|nr:MULTISPECIES: hypothetical protein [unclassified Nocardia]MBF6193862.1 hypothetical protein [Nocardia beijingensis]MEA3529400.1 hypothetical protein [Nocardia sp. CDC192]MEB3511986.1 hypothetical protein [Nocardia sp. CDC186]
MLTHIANGDDSRLSFWLRVREFAVPPTMIETATARRRVGDWAGACAAAGFDIDFSLRSVTRSHGHALAARIRADLRHLAPDLLRWHMPRVAPDGLLRPGLTIALARYDAEPDLCGGAPPMHLVARTAPAWADAGQRISLALWDGSAAGAGLHPHPRPDRRFRLDLHRHLWDARRVDELGLRSGAAQPANDRPVLDPELLATVPQVRRCAVDRWAAEAEILHQAEGRRGGAFVVRFGARQRLVLYLDADDGAVPPTVRIAAEYPLGGVSALPVLPDAATWVLPDLELIRTGAIAADRLHPLVAPALVPDYSPSDAPRLPDRADTPRLVRCRGEQHRIGLVDGVLSALDHDQAEIRREELLVALTGTPLPCLRAIDEAHRHPDCLAGVRERLDHGDTAGALAIVGGLLGPDAILRDGALRDELETSARRRITYGLFKSGLSELGIGRIPPMRRPRDRRAHPRNATSH